MVTALLKLGFAGISETALGAEVVTSNTAQFLNNAEPGIYISTACPSAVDYIRKYQPTLTRCLVNMQSPLMAHASMLRRWYGDDIRVVFIGPCVAKKTESDDFPSLIDASLTFNDLRRWFEEEGFLPELMFPGPSDTFMPAQATDGALYPIDGGMVGTIKNAQCSAAVNFMHISGIANIKQALNGLEEVSENAKIFIELLVCEGGCINGPGTSSKAGTIVKNLKVDQYRNAPPLVCSPADWTNNLPDIYTSYCFVKQDRPIKYWSEEDIIEALKTAGKTSKEDELNCGGCGYNSCRDFAIAMLNDMAERQMCVSYMRRVAADKASVLLQRMPYGVVLVDDRLQIIESNRLFAELIGNDATLLWDAKPGLQGADMKKMVAFHKVFSNVLSSGNNLIDRNIEENDRLFNLSVFTIQRHRIICGIIQDLHHPGLMQEDVMRRIKQVVHENMTTVQKVAFLLGENAARTEAMLNTVINNPVISTVDEEG
ncbi:[Fe-Fe] hydrogenase large subunit C-terminal domain-containing protein [Lentimicrobium sp.]